MLDEQHTRTLKTVRLGSGAAAEGEEEDSVETHAHEEERARTQRRLLQQRSAQRAKELEADAKEEKELEDKMKLMSMTEDDDLALKYGHKWWYQKYAAANKLHEKAAYGDKMNEEQLHKIERRGYMYAMWQRAYKLTFPQVLGDARKPTGGDTVIMEGGRRPVPLEILTNVKGTRRTKRSRRDSNPRVRLRHRFHDLITRSRGSVPKMRTDGGGSSYQGEPSGINPKAKHGLDLAWTKQQQNAKRLEKKYKK